MSSAIELLFGLRLSSTPDVTELEGAIHDDDLLAELGGGGDREVDRDRRPADATLGAEDGDDQSGLAGSPLRPLPVPDPFDAAAEAIAIRLCFSRSRVLTWRIEAVSSSLLNGLTRNSRAPASMDRRR